MDDHTDILFIDAHSESRCRDHNLKFTGYKGILIRRFLPDVHPAMIGPGRESVPGQTSRQLRRPMRPRYIDDRRATLSFEQAPQSLIFLRRIRLGQYFEVQIRPGGFRSEHFEFERKFLPKITSDVLDDLLFRRSSKTGNGNRLGHILLFLNRSDKIADIQIIDSEILSPRRKTMRLVDYEPHDIPSQNQPFDRSRTQRFGRNVKDGSRSVFHPFERLRPFDRIEQTVDGNSISNLGFFQVIDLIFHKRL